MKTSPTRSWRRIDGVLLLDKPVGMSSNAALQKARRLFQAEKGGHMGTLDPFASGLLPLCFGEATKFSRFVLDADKTYRATLRLGVTTATGDPEGDVIETREITQVDRFAVETALARFHGIQQQIPPRHAALKYQGRTYYEYARAGIEIPREARAIEIHALRLIDFAPPVVVIDAHVSKGTYIRTLAEDLGAVLGCGAHLAALRRLQSGPFSMATAHTLEMLEAASDTERMANLLPTETLIQPLPRADLDPAAAVRFSQGQRLALRDVAALSAPDQTVYAVFSFPPLPQRESDANFLGVAEARDGALRPLRLVVSP
ncbi:MAG: tRNA pseudouridine(55) synthase TruB [Proteobacteria bacterium]|nr:tRNA pseudouridine(55) synthase TruB [Pseudomonadota bacterium]